MDYELHSRIRVIHELHSRKIVKHQFFSFYCFLSFYHSFLLQLWNRPLLVSWAMHVPGAGAAQRRRVPFPLHRFLNGRGWEQSRKISALFLHRIECLDRLFVSEPRYFHTELNTLIGSLSPIFVSSALTAGPPPPSSPPASKVPVARCILPRPH